MPISAFSGYENDTFSTYTTPNEKHRVQEKLFKKNRKPELFHHNDDSRVVLWQPEVQERGEERDKEGVQQGVQEDSNIIKIVSAIRGNTVSTKEIKIKMNLKGRSNFTSRFLHPSIKKGYVAPLYPDAPKRRDQAYYLTEKGLALYAEISKEN